MFRGLLIAITLALVLACKPVYSDGCPSAPVAGPGAPAAGSSAPACAPGIAEFFRGIAGEWIGTCKQSTDGDAADDKYFRAVIKESSPGYFEAHFDYYRTDDKGALQHIGSSNVTATVSSATSATGRVIGDGEVLVDQKVKKQEHDLTETLVSTSTGVVTARGSGSLKVAGMPLGLGKLGKVREDQSTWSLTDGTLTVRQSMSIVFRALFVSKSFKVDAEYSAVRGSDVSALVSKPAGAAIKSGG